MDYLTERRNKKLGLLPEKEKKVKPIAHFSKKREKKQREYRKIVKEMLSKDARCKINSPVCTGIAQGLHHIVKRSPKNLIDKNNLIPSCNRCNGFVEQNIDWAIEGGFIKSKYLKQ